MFYQVFFLLYGISFTLQINNSQWLLLVIVHRLAQLSVCCSMYLMMDHNKKQYLKFLRIIYIFKLHWICLCWRHFVIDEINSLNEETQQVSNLVTDMDKNNDNNNNQQSQLETGNISIDDQKIEMPELSSATKTE